MVEGRVLGRRIAMSRVGFDLDPSMIRGYMRINGFDKGVVARSRVALIPQPRFYCKWRSMAKGRTTADATCRPEGFSPKCHSPSASLRLGAPSSTESSQLDPSVSFAQSPWGPP